MFDSTCRSAAPGLRERKKLQTRRRIVEVGLAMCDENGFEATTVEQIAEAADVSTRTVNRYFELKEDIVLGPIEDFTAAIAAELRKVPPTEQQLDALRIAYMNVVLHADEPGSQVPFTWFQRMQRIVQAAPSVKRRSLDYTDTKSRALCAVVGERMSLPADAVQVRLLVSMWNSIVHTGMNCEAFVCGQKPVTPESSVAEVQIAFDEFFRLAAIPRADTGSGELTTAIPADLGTIPVHPDPVPAP
ncbi:TetR/AcrR family transcriptional regulator [Nocardia stercoris]|uniref:TetR family transcriptional regulator n=1 Tax=Nocardia stercoris TaxID=2483361 RepID=A0A3M2L307_9NOCA|nr:TetR/AcrR family transcriptional regulator [Nocardia stercoris]RMI31774.1 TetR family transcriptional regulator [Nocardia stercoris]